MTLPPKADLLPTPRFNDSCASQILTLIRSFHDLIWVYGGCELLEQDIASINLAIERYLDSGLLLVLHNGLVSISSQQPLNGFIYHLVTLDSLQFTDWSKTVNDKPPSRVSQTIAQLPTAQLSKQQISYFQHGRFYPLGGLILDAPNYYALVNGELSTKYSQSITEPVAKYFHSKLGPKVVGMIFNQIGMSLIEVLIALAIVAVGAIGLVKLQVDVEVKSETANQRLMALNLAESHLRKVYSQSNLA